MQEQQDLQMLVVENDAEFRSTTANSLRPHNEVSEAGTLAEARALLIRRSFEVVLLDKSLPDGEAITLVREIRENDPNCVIIILTGDEDQRHMARYVDAGADDYVRKSELAGLDLKIRIPAALAAMAERRRSSALEGLIHATSRNEIIGRSVHTLKLRERIHSLKGNRAPVLITGESGTGKELVARMLNAIEQRKGPLVTVNCGAIPENLIESELFGFKKGAFTGANHDQIGKFERAHNGDIFLDEVGELPLAAQVKLLRVLNDGEFHRVGDPQERRVSVRVIAATHRDLQQLVEEKKFRQDLYYRLNVIPVHTAPLRERTEDIPEIAHFLVALVGQGTFRLREDAIAPLLAHPWPGNVRELRNSIERALIEAKIRGSVTIERKDFGFLQQERRPTSASTSLSLTLDDVTIAALEEHLCDSEREFFDAALPLFGGNVEALAKHMGYGRSTLFRRLQAIGLGRKRVAALPGQPQREARHDFN